MKDERFKKCKSTGLDMETCSRLIGAVDKLDQEASIIWGCSVAFEKDSKNYEKLDKTYTTIQDAMGWLRDIIGDVD